MSSLTEILEIKVLYDYYMQRVREAAKKIFSSWPGHEEGGGGVKGRAIEEKITFFKTFFKILLPFENKNYITLENLSKYGHITLREELFLRLP